MTKQPNTRRPVPDEDQPKQSIWTSSDGEYVLVPDIIIPHAVSWIAFFGSLYFTSFYALYWTEL